MKDCKCGREIVGASQVDVGVCSGCEAQEATKEFCAVCDKWVPLVTMPEGDICNKHGGKG